MNNSTEQSLRKRLEALEQDTANEDLFRLTQGRNQALQQKPRKTKPIFWPAIATSLGSALLIAVLYTPTGSVLSPENEIITEDFYSDLADENLDFYYELEFYDWLADLES